MIVWDDAQSIMQRLAQDTSTDGITFQKLMANTGYKHVLNALGRAVTEKVKTATTVASQRAYQIPPDTGWVKHVGLVWGTQKQPLDEVDSEEVWDWFTSHDYTGVPQRYFYRPRFGHNGGIIELDPIPGASTYTIRLTVEATDKDMTVDVYTTGTVSVTNGSANITGSGTTFTADMVGRYLKLTASGADRLWYRVKTFSSTTALVLENVYEGSTGSGLTFQISEAFSLPEEMQILPVYYAMWHWFESKKDSVQSAKYKRMWDEGLKQAQNWHATRTRSGVVHYDDYVSPFTPAMPFHFPESVT